MFFYRKDHKGRKELQRPDVGLRMVENGQQIIDYGCQKSEVVCRRDVPVPIMRLKFATHNPLRSLR